MGHNNHSSHGSHGSHASHDSHSSHGSHANHSNHNSHNSHTNHLNHNNTLNPVCDAVGTTMPRVSEETATKSSWDDLISKVNQVRQSWDLPANVSSADETPNSEILADDWNTKVRQPLNEAPISSIGGLPEGAEVGEEMTSPGYEAGVQAAESKLCVTVCSSVCTSVSHANHANHSSHSSHNSHGNHGNHKSHNSTLCLQEYEAELV